MKDQLRTYRGKGELEETDEEMEARLLAEIAALSEEDASPVESATPATEELDVLMGKSYEDSPPSPELDSVLKSRDVDVAPERGKEEGEDRAAEYARAVLKNLGKDSEAEPEPFDMVFTVEEAKRLQQAEPSTLEEPEGSQQAEPEPSDMTFTLEELEGSQQAEPELEVGSTSEALTEGADSLSAPDPKDEGGADRLGTPKPGVPLKPDPNKTSQENYMATLTPEERAKYLAEEARLREMGEEAAAAEQRKMQFWGEAIANAISPGVGTSMFSKLPDPVKEFAARQQAEQQSIAAARNAAREDERLRQQGMAIESSAQKREADILRKAEEEASARRFGELLSRYNRQGEEGVASLSEEEEREFWQLASATKMGQKWLSEQQRREGNLELEDKRQEGRVSVEQLRQEGRESLERLKAELDKKGGKGGGGLSTDDMSTRELKGLAAIELQAMGMTDAQAAAVIAGMGRSGLRDFAEANAKKAVQLYKESGSRTLKAPEKYGEAAMKMGIPKLRTQTIHVKNMLKTLSESDKIWLSQKLSASGEGGFSFEKLRTVAARAKDDLQAAAGSPEAQRRANAAQMYVLWSNDLIKAQAGAAVTASEAGRIGGALGMGSLNPQALDLAVERTLATLRNDEEALTRTYNGGNLITAKFRGKGGKPETRNNLTFYEYYRLRDAGRLLDEEVE